MIDGVFHQRLAPTPQECARVARTRPAFGAASMGALRAVECARYGFVPLGAIARWYRSGAIDGDDEVAVITDATGSTALSVPSVNVRFAARLAVRRGWIDAAAAAGWIARARAIFYAERRWSDLVAMLPAPARDALASLGPEALDLKRIDARSALRAALRRIERPGTARLPRIDAGIAP